MELSNTVKYKINDRPGARGISTGGLLKYCLFLLKAFSQCPFHFPRLFLRKSLKIGSHVGVKCEINLDMEFNLPRKPRISFSVLGDGISMIALTLSGSTLISSSLTMNVSSFLEVAPNVHLGGFNFN
ncbi:hypothetical protein E5676_scaffold284G00980 [Cucumis melo var. makuwa]|uniref:Uncharacterized protein n=1 Tax=Cucumis melo var. makuwa TaxID=1194695 RepID=A0A5D3DBV4_CUCMM|nr:hypothetical protein E5676_scaffold284G00980 [Cucumis melo var. makuwa]